MMSSAPLRFLFLIFQAFNSMLICSTTTTSNTSDMQTLISFKSIISDPNGVLASWNHSLHFCQWPGVTCGRNSANRVSALMLDSLGLKGQIPALLANLSFLQQLNLADNNFGGQIPQELGKLSLLQYLNLSTNNLDGNIPVNLTGCSNLQKIDLYQNDLSGEIPRDIGMLGKLLVIDVSINSLSGSFPPSIGNLSSLQVLFVYENNLEGSIPQSLGRLSSMVYFNLRDNKLSGSIPSSFYNLSNIKQISLAINLFEGTLPANMFDTFPNLRLLYLYNNRFHGPLPTSLSNTSVMVDLQMRMNSFSGVIPPELGNMKFLQTLNLGENQLEASKPSDWRFFTSLSNCSFLKNLIIPNNRLLGTFPSSLVNLSSSMERLGMYSNQIYGSIPTGIGNLGNLTVIDFSDNHLTGTIPASIGRLQNLHFLNLSANNLTEAIPFSFGNLTKLIGLYLYQNKLNGSIPGSIGDCISLQELDLSQNKLTGPIPKQLFNISSLTTYLNLSKNLLSGPLPDQVGNLKNLGEIVVADNKLSGEIPSALTECQSLEYLYLQKNYFQGTIPPSLSNLKGLLQLDLSGNNLTGEIPTSLQKLGALQYLNLSFNDLEGEVPTDGIFKNITEASVRGNTKLCGGNPGLRLHLCNANPENRKTHILVKVLAPILSLFLCSLIFMIIFIVCYKSKKLRKRFSRKSLFKNEYARVSYAELLRATDEFSASNLIGVGSFGSVYKGVMERKVVAIKVLNLQQHGASKSFMTECEVLRSIRHRNLVKIITSCSSTDYKGNEFKALVLKYMPNGSLENWLHRSTNETSSTNTLTLSQRLDIAIDMASVLNYLQHDASVPITHCDLKPSNVLLDEEMHAHLSDFGLARLLHDKFPKTDESLTASTAIKGTIGYIAPEYGMGGQTSTNGDIYSYGIILLELLTGKRPTNDMFKEGLSLYTYVQMTPPERILDIVDPSILLSEIHIEGGSVELQKCIDEIFKIGLSCSKEDPTERMQISDVIKELNATQKILFKLRRTNQRTISDR